MNDRKMDDKKINKKMDEIEKNIRQVEERLKKYDRKQSPARDPENRTARRW